MATCPTPSTTTTTYPRSTPMDTSCDLLAEWQDCSTCGGDFAGYDKNDAPVTICVNGVMMIAQSLTDEPNSDNPITGAFSVTPPTWSLITLTGWMATKQDALVGTGAVPLDGGTCVPTCDELAAVQTNVTAAINSLGETVTQVNLDAQSAAQNALDAAGSAASDAAAAQGQLTDANGGDHATGDCVPSCSDMNSAISDATNFGSVFSGDATALSPLGIDCTALKASCDLVQSADFGTGFDVDPATGAVTITPTSACDATMLTQAQVDAAANVVILACLDDGAGGTTVGAVTSDMIAPDSEPQLVGSSSDCSILLPEGLYYISYRAYSGGTGGSCAYTTGAGLFLIRNGFRTTPSGMTASSSLEGSGLFSGDCTFDCDSGEIYEVWAV